MYRLGAHTDEGNAQRAMLEVLKQRFQEVPSEASKLVALHQVAEGPFAAEAADQHSGDEVFLLVLQGSFELLEFDH